jgi:integrase
LGWQKPQNDCDFQLQPTTDGSRDRIISYEEEKNLMNELNDWQKDVVQVALNTGLRKGEIEKLKVEYVNFEISTILIPKNTQQSPNSTYLQ